MNLAGTIPYFMALADVGGVNKSRAINCLFVSVGFEELETEDIVGMV